MTLQEDEYSELVRLALEEDVGAGDVTAEFFVPAGAEARAVMVAREPAAVAGTEVAAAVFAAVDPDLAIEVTAPDGTLVEAGDAIMVVSGRTRSILTAERTALNFLQRLSGVATAAKTYVDAVEGLPAKILDTRKTTPGWRRLEKAAVKAGGGENHRMGLYDMVMVKDNHLLAEDRAAALQEAIDAARVARPEIRIELEADTLDQVEAFLGLRGVDVILLDNMSNEALRAAVEKAGGKVALEASGGVTLETVRAIAETGVNFVSVGAITHSAPSVDISLELRDEE